MPLDILSVPPSSDRSALQRIGTLSTRCWHAKLYAPVLEAGGLRPEDLAAAERAYLSSIAAPGVGPIGGFSLLQPGCDGDLALSAYWWEGALLHRTALLLPGCGSPPRRRSAAIHQIGDVDEVLLMGREAAAWRRWVLDTDVPSLDGYLAECCT